MPLIVITGLPCSGKTTRTADLKQFFESKQLEVKVVSEADILQDAGFDKNTYFGDSQNEKGVRGKIKSSVQRLLNSQDILIIDGSNYIKGCRYEIYCLSKLYKTPQCTIQCNLPVEHAWLWNEKRPKSEQYTRTIFDALVMRYEEPDNRNRWDSPLFTVLPEDELQFDQIYSALFQVKAPKPNMSTQCPALSSANYLYNMDKITQEIINDILAAKQIGIENDVKIRNYDITLKTSGSASQLTKLRRQFLTYTKMQQVAPDQIPVLFIQYLNSCL